MANGADRIREINASLTRKIEDGTYVLPKFADDRNNNSQTATCVHDRPPIHLIATPDPTPTHSPTTTYGSQRGTVYAHGRRSRTTDLGYVSSIHMLGNMLGNANIAGSGDTA